MKREIIVQGMRWGHLPSFLIDDDFRAGRLLSIADRHLKGGKVDLVAARRRDRPHGPVAERLWRFVQDQAPALRRLGKPLSTRPRAAPPQSPKRGVRD